MVTYIPSPSKRQAWKRQIICFNTLYTANVKSNVGNVFVTLFSKHFPRHHKYYKPINRNNIKLSYRCIPNINNVIQKYNYKITKNPAPSTTETCNCRRKTDCSMDDYRLFECLIYKAFITATTNNYFYGSCENTFKERYNNHHKCSFRKKSLEKNTELSKYVWKLKKRVVNYLINWDIATKSQNYVCGLRKCDFCTCVKLLIARADLNVFLNKPDDPVLKWRHRNNLLWIALKIDKIIYAIRCMKLYLFFFLSINIVENYLMIGDMKHSVMVICCCGLYSILGAVIARAGKRF